MQSYLNLLSLNVEVQHTLGDIFDLKEDGQAEEV